MKKLVIMGVGVFILSGCGAVKGESIKCKYNNMDAVFTFNNGTVIEYTLNGKSVGREKIDSVNGSVFATSKNNNEAKEALYAYIDSLGGSCEKN